VADVAQRRVTMDEKLTAFHDQLQDLIGEHVTEELSHGTLIQDLMSLSVSVMVK
jgi:hypothetical protein